MKRGYLIDMDGVVYRGATAIPGAAEFIAHLHEEKIPYLFLTNNSTYTPLDVVFKLQKMGIDTTQEHVYTSGMATRPFCISRSRTAPPLSLERVDCCWR
jgi:ribonucleotide monophosphatase NagD (HAD superfamily)